MDTELDMEDIPFNCHYIHMDQQVYTIKNVCICEHNSGDDME